MYWQGCGLSGIYPVSLVLDGMALNITLVSRHDQVDFGLIGCRKTLPSLQRLLDDLEDELAALERLI
jgi:diacylglycerol O-acyltransferase